MTLIANFPASSGVAICADSQETITEYDPVTGPYDVRVTVQKISRIEKGKYQIAICGGGHAGLIENFIVRAERAIEQEDAAACTVNNPAGVLRVHVRLEKELRKFYQNDVRLCPDPDEHKKIKLFVAASCPIAKQYAVWVSENIVLRPVHSDNPELNGWEHNLYVETAKRLFRSGMAISQAALASIYTLTIAKDTSNYVKDPLALAIVDGTGIHLVPQGYVRAMEDRLQEFEAATSALFLKCSDTGVSVSELESEIKEFEKAALGLHRSQIDQQATMMTVNELFDNRGLRSLPKGPIYLKDSGKLEVEHDPQKIQATRKKFELVRILGGAGPVIVTVRCPQGHTFEREFQNHSSAYGSTVKCETCGETKILREMGQGAPDDIRLKTSTPSSAQK